MIESLSDEMHPDYEKISSTGSLNPGNAGSARQFGPPQTRSVDLAPSSNKQQCYVPDDRHPVVCSYAYSISPGQSIKPAADDLVKAGYHAQTIEPIACRDPGQFSRCSSNCS